MVMSSPPWTLRKTIGSCTSTPRSPRCMEPVTTPRCVTPNSRSSLGYGHTHFAVTGQSDTEHRMCNSVPSPSTFHRPPSTPSSPQRPPRTPSSPHRRWSLTLPLPVESGSTAAVENGSASPLASPPMPCKRSPSCNSTHLGVSPYSSLRAPVMGPLVTAASVTTSLRPVQAASASTSKIAQSATLTTPSVTMSPRRVQASAIVTQDHRIVQCASDRLPQPSGVQAFGHSLPAAFRQPSGSLPVTCRESPGSLPVASRNLSAAVRQPSGSLSADCAEAETSIVVTPPGLYGPPTGVRREAGWRAQQAPLKNPQALTPNTGVPVPPSACPRQLRDDEGLAGPGLVADPVLRTPDPVLQRQFQTRVLPRCPSPSQPRRSLPANFGNRGVTAAEEIIGIWEEDLSLCEQVAEGRCIESIRLESACQNYPRTDTNSAMDEVQPPWNSVERMCSAPARVSSAGCLELQPNSNPSFTDLGVVIWSPASVDSDSTSRSSEGEPLEEIVSPQLHACFDRIMGKAQQIQAEHEWNQKAEKKGGVGTILSNEYLPSFEPPAEDPLPDEITYHRPPTTIRVPIHEERSLDCTLDVTFLVPAGQDGKDFMFDLRSAFDSEGATAEECVLVPCGGSRTALVMLRSLGPCEAINHVKRWASEAHQPSATQQKSLTPDAPEGADETCVLPRALVYVVQRQNCVDGTEQQLGPICRLEASYAAAKGEHQPCRFMAALHQPSEMFVEARDAEVPGPVGAEFLRQLEQRGVQQLPCTAVIKGNMASYHALLVYIVETLVAQQELSISPITASCGATFDCRLSERMTSTPTSRRSLHTSTSQSSLPTLGSNFSCSRTSSTAAVSESYSSFVLAATGHE